MTAAQKLAAVADDCRITKLERTTVGQRTYWTAHITLSGQTFDVDCKYGSWMVVHPGGARRAVLPAYAARLQERVHAEERRAAKTEEVHA